MLISSRINERRKAVPKEIRIFTKVPNELYFQTKGKVIRGVTNIAHQSISPMISIEFSDMEL